MSNQFPGSLFYEYHQQFSARAAQFLERGIKLDWSVRDEHIHVRYHIHGSTSQPMQHMPQRVAYSTTFCPTSRPSGQKARDQDTKGRNVVTLDSGKQICNNFNTESGCNYSQCRRAHICKRCKQPHSIVKCATHNNSK